MRRHNINVEVMAQTSSIYDHFRDESFIIGGGGGSGGEGENFFDNLLEGRK